MREDEIGRDIEIENEESPSSLVCPHCLTPNHPFAYYCKNCGEAISPYTPYLPFINILFICNFYRGIWKKLWFDRRASLPMKATCFLFITLFVPIMLVGLPFMLWDKIRSGRGKNIGPVGRSS